MTRLSNPIERWDDTNTYQICTSHCGWVHFTKKSHNLTTLSETNIAPENKPSQNETSPTMIFDFSGAMLVSGSVTISVRRNQKPAVLSNRWLRNAAGFGQKDHGFTNRKDLTFSYGQHVLSSFCSLSSPYMIYIYFWLGSGPSHIHDPS